MGMKGDFGIIDANNFDKQKLNPGEIAVFCATLREGKDKTGGSLIDLGLEIIWTAHPDDAEYVGQRFDQAFFFGRQYLQMTLQQLRNFFKQSGCDIRQWTANNNLPESVMIPGGLKTLVTKGYNVLCKVVSVPGKKEGDSPTNYINFIRVLRTHPATGEALGDYPPNPWPPEVILDGYNTELTADQDGSGGGGGKKTDIF